MKIMIVDDSSTMRRILANSLKKIADTESIEAGDGKEALSELKINKDIDLMFVDWNMPTMNGHEFLMEVKASDEFKHIPVIIVAAETEKRQIIAAIKAGAANYVIKPFAQDIIEAKINSTLKA